MIKTIQVRILPQDKERLMKECVDKYRETFPELKNVHITEHMILSRVIDKYLGRF